MRESEYRAIYSAEDTHWWYRGLRELVFESLRDYSRTKNGKGLKVLDAGCGTGATLVRLSREGYAGYGLDFSATALGFCRERGMERLARGSVTGLPFKGSSFDAVVSLDVIYHAAVQDDIGALKEFRRVLKKDGILIMNLPAYEFLRSPHDLANQTKTRYTKRMLAEKLCSAGFTAERLTYRNAALFPLIAAVRLAKKLIPGRPESRDSDLGEVNPFVNRALSGLLLVENRLIKSVSMPFGTSVFCVARRD